MSSLEHLEMVTNEVAANLKTDGWAHIRSDIDPFDRADVRNLFSVMNRKLAIDSMQNSEISVIAPKENTRVLATSHDAMSFHTDNVYLDNPCKTVALFCAVQADEGGDNELVDALAVAKIMPEHTLEQLKMAQWHWANPIENGPSPDYAVVDDSVENIRWWRMGIVPQKLGAYAAANTFEEGIVESETKVHVRMQPGDLLVTDNTRIVHNRSAFSGRRHVYRARFW